MHRITTSRHPVEIGPLIDSGIHAFLAQPAISKARKFILVDENSLQHCIPALMSAVEGLRGAELIEVESGEPNKNIVICTHIWEALSDMQADRNALFVNLGGGVITDMGGFIASTFKRGIRFINIPTTLLSQVDASVGGKVGVDLNGLKNQVGVFADPQVVYIDPAFLSTLSPKELRSGFAEVVKHALIADANYWKEIRKIDPAHYDNWQEVIVRSVEIKKRIVEEDPHEIGLRKILNFGHTIGHAVESHSLEGGKNPLTHGESIAIGMIAEAWLSHKKRKLSQQSLEEIVATITAVFPAHSFDDLDHHRLVELMRNDKKNQDNSINFTLLDDIGKAHYDQTCNAEEIRDALKYYLSVVKSK
jgi:3-dehydroquinate synthase